MPQVSTEKPWSIDDSRIVENILFDKYLGAIHLECRLPTTRLLLSYSAIHTYRSSSKPVLSQNTFRKQANIIATDLSCDIRVHHIRHTQPFLPINNRHIAEESED